MKYLFFAFFVSNVLVGFSQSGNYFLSHHSPSKDRFDNVCFQMAQHEDGMLYFATRTGILQFDGKSWNLIQGKGAIYTLQITPEGKILWGGVNGYGYVQFNKQGTPELNVLSTGVKNVFQSVLLSDEIYFINDEKLHIVNKNDYKSTSITATELTGAFTGVFEYFGGVYVNTSKSGIYKISNQKLVRSTTGLENLSTVVFSSDHQGRHLVGLTNNRIYISEQGRAPRQLIIEDQDYIDQSVVVNGSWVNSQMIVLGTLRGGLVFVNTSNGKTQEIINYATGLPDNEIFTLFYDKSQGIWAAHEYGFTRISPYLPFRSYNHYPGLQGNLLCAITYRNGVYVGTSLGLFKLEKEDIYEEISYFVDVPVKGKRKNKKDAKTASAAVSEEEPVAVQSKKRGLLSRLFRRNVTEETSSQNGGVPESPALSDEEYSPSEKIKKTRKVFTRSDFAYKKVKGIEAKISQLIEVKGNLIAGGLGGTYKIDGLTAQTISGTPTRFIYGSEQGWLLVSTYSDNVNTYFNTNGSWKKQSLLDNLNDQITDIFEDDQNDLWLCALDKIYRLKTSAGEVKDIQVIEVQNPSYDEYVGMHHNKNTILANSQGFHLYNDSSRSFQLIDTLSQDHLSNYFASANTVWYKDLHGWHVFGEESDLKNLGLLNLFQNIRFLIQDKTDEDLWLITGENELFRFSSDRLNPYVSSFPLTLKLVRNGELKMGGQRLDLSLDEDYGSLTVEVVQPDYLGADAIEYRYNLRGLDEKWSDWSQSNNLIEIPYLPSGDYTLDVESRDLFGRIQSMKAVSLVVIPPFWKRPWFYALEVLFFSFLVILSFRLSVRYRIISRLLMLLTIIMLIQFIETIVGQTFETKTSPVIDFFLQVVIAMLVLPIEGYLRDLMLRSLDSNNRFYKFISPKIGSTEGDNADEA